jgi:hypothetical protein
MPEKFRPSQIENMVAEALTATFGTKEEWPFYMFDKQVESFIDNAGNPEFWQLRPTLKSPISVESLSFLVIPN